MNGLKYAAGAAFVVVSLLIFTVLTILNLQATNPPVQQEELLQQQQQIENQQDDDDNIPPSTPLASVTPRATLRPPPTFEPPTLTPPPTLSPTPTEFPTLMVDVDTSQIRGLETDVPTEEACEPRRDWQLTYEVQAFDTLEAIANKYGTNPWALAEANCIVDMNVISIGQRLRVPGDAHPSVPQYVCDPWEVLTPMDWAYNVDGMGQVTFNWRGPRAERYLVRVFDANGTVVFERTQDRAHNMTVNLALDFPSADGQYTWYVYPLDLNFLQIPCTEGGPWHFHKSEGPPNP